MLDTRIGTYSMPMNQALDTAGQLSQLMLQQAMAPLQKRQLMLANQGEEIKNQYMPQSLQSANARALAEAAKINAQLLYPFLMGNSDTKSLGIADLYNKGITSLNPYQMGTMGINQLQGNAQGIGQQQMQPTQGNLSSLVSALRNMQQTPPMMRGVSGSQGMNQIPQQQVPVQQSPQGDQGSDAQGLSNLADMMKSTVTSKIDKAKAQTGHLKAITNAGSYLSKPPEEKEQTLARFREAGVPEDEGVKMMMNNPGLTENDIIRQYGKDPKDITGNGYYAKTKTQISRDQNRAQAAAELQILNDRVTDWVAPYAQRIPGIMGGRVSPAVIIKAMQGENPIAIAKVLAANQLLPEIAGAKARGVGMTTGIEALREIENSMRGKLTVPGVFVTPEAQRLGNKFSEYAITDAIRGSANAVNPQNGGFYQKTGKINLDYLRSFDADDDKGEMNDYANGLSKKEKAAFISAMMKKHGSK